MLESVCHYVAVDHVFTRGMNVKNFQSKPASILSSILMYITKNATKHHRR